MLTEMGQGVPLDPWNVGVPPMSEVTRILSALEQGDPHAAEQLLPLVYEELRKLAAQKMAQEAAGPHASANRPGPRGVPAPGGRTVRYVGGPRPLLRRRRGSHAPHPGRERPPQEHA